jgi:hypothetical protein
MVTFKIQPSRRDPPLDESSFTLESETAPDPNEWTWDSISLDTTMVTENEVWPPFSVSRAAPQDASRRYVAFRCCRYMRARLCVLVFEEGSE